MQNLYSQIWQFMDKGRVHNIEMVSVLACDDLHRVLAC